MKRYIRTASALSNYNIFEGTPFKCDTDTSYYNNFLNAEDLKYMQNNKNRTGEVVLMSPNEYFSECANKIFNNSSVAKLKSQREYDADLNQQYAEDMKSGDKFPLCYINYADSGQEGLHRMMVAGDLYGWDTKFPVLVVNVYDENIEHIRELAYETSKFINYDFFWVCKDGIGDAVIEGYDESADNLPEIIRQHIIANAKERDWAHYEYDHFDNTGFDIDVAVEISGDDITIYLTRYFDYELGSYYHPEFFSIEKEFHPSKSDYTQSEDLDDIDLDDLFFS